MTVIDAVDAITHEARGALGTIRLVVTTLLDNPPDDADTRNRLLRAADSEALMLVADLAALSSLVTALTVQGPPREIDITDALRDAARDLAATGVAVEVDAPAPLRINGTEAFTPAFAALLRYGAARGATIVRAEAVDDSVVRVSFPGAGWRGPLVQHAVAVLGAGANMTDESFTLAHAGGPA